VQSAMRFKKRSVMMTGGGGKIGRAYAMACALASPDSDFMTGQLLDGTAIFTDRENSRPVPQAPIAAGVAETSLTARSAIASYSEHRLREKRP